MNVTDLKSGGRRRPRSSLHHHCRHCTHCSRDVPCFEARIGKLQTEKVDVNQQPAKADLLLPKPQDRTVEQLSGEVTAVRNQAAKLESKLIESNENVRVLLGKLEALAKDRLLPAGLVTFEASLLSR